MIWFPAYRDFDEARIAANDAMMALLVSSRIARHFLRAANSDDFLTDAFAVEEVERLNVTVERAQSIIFSAERDLAYMAIPYTLSVYQGLIARAILFLRENAGASGDDDPFLLHLSEMHHYADETCGIQLPDHLVSLFEIIRKMRNRLTHHGARTGSRLRSDYAQLPAATRDVWEGITGRPLPVGSSSEYLLVGSPELRGVLAITTRLARAVNYEVRRLVPKEAWARVVALDYRSQSPIKFGIKPQRTRRLLGFSQQFYSGIELTRDELEQAAEEVEVEQEGKEGRSSC